MDENMLLGSIWHKLETSLSDFSFSLQRAKTHNTVGGCFFLSLNFYSRFSTSRTMRTLNTTDITLCHRCECLIAIFPISGAE